MNKKLGQDVVIFNTGHFIDVFYGKMGWKPHARFQRKRVNGVFMWASLSGGVLPGSVMAQLQKELK